MAMYKTFISIYILFMCINGMVIVGESLTEQYILDSYPNEPTSMSSLDFNKYCFDVSGNIIGTTDATGTFIATYTNEAACTTANATNEWRSPYMSGDATTQGILASDGTYVTGLTNQTGNPLALIAGEVMIWDAIWDFINILTAGNLFTLLGTWGFPDVFVELMQGIMGIYLALTIISIKWQF